MGAVVANMRKARPNRVRVVPALWEVYHGNRYVGYVEAPYSHAPTWEAYFDGEDIGRFMTKRLAIAAIRKRLGKR